MKMISCTLSILLLFFSPLKAASYTDSYTPQQNTQAMGSFTTAILCTVGAGVVGLMLGAAVGTVGTTLYHASDYYKAAHDNAEQAILDAAEQELGRITRETHDLLMLRAITLDDLITYCSHHGRAALVPYEEQVQMLRTRISAHRQQLQTIAGTYTATHSNIRRERARRLYEAYSAWDYTVSLHEQVLQGFCTQRDRPLHTLASLNEKAHTLGIHNLHTITTNDALKFAHQYFACMPTEDHLYGFPILACTTTIAALVSAYAKATILLATSLYQHDNEVQQALSNAQRNVTILSKIYTTLNNTPHMHNETNAHQRTVHEQLVAKQHADYAKAELQTACNRAREVALEEERLTLLSADIAARTTQNIIAASHEPCKERERKLRADLERMQKALKQQHSRPYWNSNSKNGPYDLQLLEEHASH